MEVTASIENPQVSAGDRINVCVEFQPSVHFSNEQTPVLLSGYALVQGSFRLGDMLLSEPFAIARKSGVVLTKRGLEYGQAKNNGSLFTGVLDGLKNLVVNAPSNSRSPKSGSGNQSAGLSHEDDGDYPIFATSQLLLFTDMKLDSPRKFHIAADLPSSLPSSYRSRSLQISYQVVIGFERLDPLMIHKPTDTKLFLNFKLLPKSPTSAEPNPEQFDLTHPINTDSPILLSSNLVNGVDTDEHESGSNDMSAFIDQLLDSSNDTEIIKKRRRSSSIAQIPGSQYTRVSYDISRNGVKIAQLLLSRPAIHIGDVLAGQIKFLRPCLHVSVSLELEESIDESCAALPSSGLVAMGGDPTVNSIAYARQHQGTYGLEELPLYLPTLTSIPPRLDTEQISAKWFLQMEFVCLTGSAFTEASETDEVLLAKSQIDHETFTCKIPIYVLPPTQGGIPATKTWRL